jgi:hypothetical protein
VSFHSLFHHFKNFFGTICQNCPVHRWQ